MTIQEIKDIFNIDIREKNRTDLHVYIRTLYVQKEVKKTSFNKIAKDLKYNHSTLLHCNNRLEDYKADPLFMYIEKAFKNKDVILLNEFKRLFEERRLQRTRATKQENYIHHLLLEKPKRLTKEEDRISIDFSQPKRTDILEVAKKLRFVKTYLNDKYFNEWTGRDWNKYNELITN